MLGFLAHVLIALPFFFSEAFFDADFRTFFLERQNSSGGVLKKLT